MKEHKEHMKYVCHVTLAQNLQQILDNGIMSAHDLQEHHLPYAPVLPHGDDPTMVRLYADAPERAQFNSLMDQTYKPAPEWVVIILRANDVGLGNTNAQECSTISVDGPIPTETIHAVAFFSDSARVAFEMGRSLHHVHLVVKPSLFLDHADRTDLRDSSEELDGSDGEPDLHLPYPEANDTNGIL